MVNTEVERRRNDAQTRAAELHRRAARFRSDGWGNAADPREWNRGLTSVTTTLVRSADGNSFFANSLTGTIAGTITGDMDC